MKILISGIIWFLVPVTAMRIFYQLVFLPAGKMVWDKDAGKGIKWDTGSLKKISPDTSRAFYPRMIQLKDGRLLVAYASRGNIVAQKSIDGGRQWQAPLTIAEKEGAVNMDTPELLQLANDELLVCYNGRPQDALKDKRATGKRFDIRIKKSDDNGMTWKQEKILYQAGELFKDGCWEPAAIQLPSGEIQLFFSNEGIYTTSNEQNISLLRSSDNGASWTVTPQIISFRKNSRDGMPVPLWLPEKNEIAVAIEDPGTINFKPAIIYSPPGGQWELTVTGSDNRRKPALADKLADSIYAGAPYLRRLSSGTSILSYQSTEGRTGGNNTADATMVVATGNEQAAKFTGKTFPFLVPEGYHALWNSLCITRGDTIIAITSTNAFSKSGSEIWMIKGTLQ